MQNYIKFLAKVENFNETNIDMFKRYLYINSTFFHMHEVNKCTLDIDAKNLDLEVFREYSDLKKCDLTIIKYNNEVDYIEKINISNGENPNIEKIYIESINDLSEYEIFNILSNYLD